MFMRQRTYNCVGYDGCGYCQEEDYKTEVEAVDAHNKAHWSKNNAYRDNQSLFVCSGRR